MLATLTAPWLFDSARFEEPASSDRLAHVDLARLSGQFEPCGEGVDQLGEQVDEGLLA